MILVALVEAALGVFIFLALADLHRVLCAIHNELRAARLLKEEEDSE